MFVEQGFQVLAEPTSTLSNTESVEDPVHSVAAGFHIASVQFNDTESRWMVTVRYTPG